MDAVAIDGPAGSGKSTVAKAVAKALSFLYIDTGAMYRAVAWKAMREGVALEEEERVGEVAESSAITFDATGTRVLVDGVDVSKEIRTPEVTGNTKFAARSPQVRKTLVRQQQALSRVRPVVMEGRDITTVVLKDARWKFYLSATPEERARRRMKEFTEAGHAVELAALAEEIRKRDESDMDVGPLKDAYENALAGRNETRLIDTTELTPDEVARRIVAMVRQETD